MASLVVLGSPVAGKRIALPSFGNTVVGRDPTCNVVLRKRTISRHHAQIIAQHDSYYLEDVGSSNGTYLNGHRIDGRAQLHDGDRINVYDVPINFYLGEESGAAASESTEHGPLPSLRPTESKTAHALSVTGDGPDILETRLHKLVEIARQLGHPFQAGQIMPLLLDLLLQMYPLAHIGEIHLRSDDGTLHPVAMKHGPSGDSALLERPSYDPQLLHDVYESGQALLQQESPSDLNVASEEADVHSVICVPITGDAKHNQGALLLQTNSAQGRFNSEDLELIGAVAVLAGQALSYTRAHELLMQHRQRERQLQDAREIQLAMLGYGRPVVNGYEFIDRYAPADAVGGDFYFYESLPGGRIMFGVADAAGKGLPAALAISQFAGEVRFRIATSRTLKEALHHLNGFVAAMGEGSFITACLCVLDTTRHTLALATAGHMPPLRKQAGASEVIPIANPRGGLPLGLDPDIVYHPISVTIEPGDQVLLYTDGVSEAMNPAGQLYRTERIVQTMLRRNDSLSALVNDVVGDVYNFRGGREASDDLCVLAFARLK